MIDSRRATIGPYRVVRRLGGGQSSEVLLATRTFPDGFERRVVVKRLRGASRESIANEAVAYARVAHPAIVQLFDFFEHDGEVALVLEYVDGVSLAQLVRSLRAARDPLTERACFYVASRVFAALAAAHAARDPATGETTPVIHRDVNPTNVLVPWTGFVKIGDFALAKVVGVSNDTRAGLMKGTYGYMAPEQVVGDAVSTKTDVYGACLVLRELLLGRPAFDSSLPELELLRAMDEAKLAPIEALRHGISIRLADAMKRGLARDPEARTLTAAEMVDVLRSEHDRDAGHGSLVAACARVKQREEAAEQAELAAQTARVARSAIEDRLDPITPRAMTLPMRESLPPTGASFAPPPRERRGVLASSLVAVATFAAIGAAVVVTVTRGGQDAPIDARAAAVVARDAAPSPVATIGTKGDASVAPSEARAAATTGSIVTPASAHNHRVFVDGKVAAWSSGATIDVACGKHAVRIAGATSLVDVPCGGSVTVEALTTR